jgi:pimeloyl-ACP methyl ester carboxylesterase
MSITKTYVLLHGAWHGGWCWKRVTPALQAAGHEVHTPTQTGLGERSHLLDASVNLETFAQDLINVFLWNDLHDVILVGHSFAGNAITAAAHRVPERISHLVYLDALIPQSGKSIFSLLPPEVSQSRRALAQKTSNGLTIPAPRADKLGVYEPKDAAWVEQKCTPHPIATYEDALTFEGNPDNGLPTTYIAVTPHYAPTAASREYAQTRSDWTYLEIEAGHDAMVTSAPALCKLLLSI